MTKVTHQGNDIELRIWICFSSSLYFVLRFSVWFLWHWSAVDQLWIPLHLQLHRTRHGMDLFCRLWTSKHRECISKWSSLVILCHKNLKPYPIIWPTFPSNFVFLYFSSHGVRKLGGSEYKPLRIEIEMFVSLKGAEIKGTKIAEIKADENWRE